MKQVGPFIEKKTPPGSPHQNLHDVLIGVKSEYKQFVLGKIAISSISVLFNFDARHLSNFIYAYGLTECIPNLEGGRTLFDVVAVQANSKLRHFNSQDISNILWAYANVGASNSKFFKAAGDSIIDLDNLSDVWPQALSNNPLGLCNCGRVTPTTFLELCRSYCFMRQLEQFLATGSIQHHLGVCNCGRVTHTTFLEPCQLYCCKG